MSKLSIIERNKKRMKMYNKFKSKRNNLLKIANNKKLSPDEQFKARLQLSKIPRNASKVRPIRRYVNKDKKWSITEERLSSYASLKV